MTREGWYWLIAAGVLFGTGLWKGINLVTLLGYLMLVLWGLNAIRARRSLRHVRLLRRLEGPVFAGTPFAVQVELDNRAGATEVGVRLEDLGAGHALRWFFSSLQRGAKVCLQREVVLWRRGWYDWQPLRASSGQPFGLWERQVSEGATGAVLVFPELGRLYRGRLRHFLARAAPQVGRARQRPCRHPTAQSEFHGLRDFRSGDSPRWIHWRTSARRGSLMIREFEETPTDNLIVILEPWLPAPAVPREQRAAAKRTHADVETPRHADVAMSPAASLPVFGRPAGGATPAPPAGRLKAPPLERAISLTATICWEWCRQKGDRCLLALAGASAALVVDGVTSLRHACTMLECLALERGSPTVDVPQLLERLAAASLPPAPILLVSTHASNLGDLLAQHLHRPVASLNVADLGQYDFYEEPRSI